VRGSNRRVKLYTIESICALHCTRIISNICILHYIKMIKSRNVMGGTCSMSRGDKCVQNVRKLEVQRPVGRCGHR
jgi:hypothetical protein